MAMTTSSSAIEIYAHRGGGGLMPENTIPAFDNAMKLGVDVVDMDVGMSKDGTVIVTHDRSLMREMTRLNGEWIERDDLFIKDKTDAELKGYDVGRPNPATDYAKKYPRVKYQDGVKIPTLREVIEFVKSQPGGDKTRFQIEIKTKEDKSNESFSPYKISEAVVGVLTKEGVADRAEVHSFDWRALENIHQQNPVIKVSYLSSFSDNFTKGEIEHEQIAKNIADLGGDVWSLDFRDLPKDDAKAKAEIKHAKELGLKVVAWTIDTKADMQRAIELGLDGIITNYPDVLKQILKR